MQEADPVYLVMGMLFMFLFVASQAFGSRCDAVAFLQAVLFRC